MKVLLLLGLFINISLAYGTYYIDLGDDAGNGGFAYKQSIKLLEESARELVQDLPGVNFSMFNDYPERRDILLLALNYENIIKRQDEEVYRNGQLLMFDYDVKINKIIVFKPYYLSFAGTSDYEFPVKKVEVKKRLLHEASHLWGFNESQSEQFSYQVLAILNNDDPSEPPPITKHDLRIRSYCACENGESIMANDCAQFCRDKNSPDPTLYLSAEIDPRDRLIGINNVKEWCQKPLDNNPAPSCHGEFYDGLATVISEVEMQGDDVLAIDLSFLSFLKAYVGKIKLNSGEGSIAFQMYLQREELTYEPVSTTSLSKYYCNSLISLVDAQDFVVRHHYYFLDSDGFSPYLSQDNIFCYDKEQYGPTDSYFYPRLGLQENFLNVFDKRNDYFLDSDGDTRPDIDNLLKEIIFRRFNINYAGNFFERIDLDSSPNTQDLAGFMLKPVLKNNKIVCPKTTIDDTTLGDKQDVMQFALSKVITTPLEGLYVAKTRSLFNSYEYVDYLYLSESRLNQIGFGIVNGIVVPLTNELMYSRSVYFYWPEDRDQPYVQHSGQLLYKVVNPYKVDGAKYLSDKKIGCIPKLETFE